MPAVSGQPQPQTVHLSVGWEIGLATTFVFVIIAVMAVAIYQFSRNRPDLRGIELEDGTRCDKNWPASTSNKRRRKRKKPRKKPQKTKARDPDLTINSESEEIEEVESFEEDMVPLPMDGVGTGGGSGSGQQHVDVP